MDDLTHWSPATTCPAFEWAAAPAWLSATRSFSGSVENHCLVPVPISWCNFHDFGFLPGWRRLCFCARWCSRRPAWMCWIGRLRLMSPNFCVLCWYSVFDAADFDFHYSSESCSHMGWMVSANSNTNWNLRHRPNYFRSSCFYGSWHCHFACGRAWLTYSVREGA